MISLGELVDIKGGGTPDKNNSEYWNGDIPWASVKDFKKNILDSTLDSITLLGVRNSATSVIPAGNIIVPTRMALGKVAINTIDLAINQDLKALFIKDNDVVDRDYLFRWLESQSSLIESEGKGATVKGITLPFLKGLNVPIPPINEQKRIAAILDKAEDIRQKREQAIKLADDFLRATFMKMFGTPAQNIHNFPKGTIRDLIDSVNYGTSAKASVDSGEYPVLRMGNITYQGGWDFTDFKYLDLSEKDKDKFLVQKGDLLFNRTNSKELVGKTAIYEEDRPMAFAGYLIRVRPNLNGNNYYLSGCLNSTYGKTTLVNMCKSIVGMANINAQELQDIEILIPPKHLQDEYENIYKKVKMGLAIFDRSAWQVQQLAANLMNKYFM
ncbi:restriction endonuclease [Salmonella enterica subsp. enterica serovar Falkensee]|nr:restriction endonuclease [Salmonella enterica subsp. enterica serovar Falkensee]EAW1947769.1 restriction endonuclease [Salmonella enterica subsp. enterica]EDT4972696.1 restriction endonuclease [Salmonella enterica subsp. enterica serovar Mbandaka]EEQ0331260.1 restriction endonuclease [Salmonella enterica]EBN9131573.1 restriction endonuclease [Salmonella enterica subsp. enterica serovar Falkensee]